MRKHRLAECLLVDVIGLDYADVHEEACRWEHVMSEAVERKLLTLLGNPTVSPFGNPIPGLEVLSGDEALNGDEPLGGQRGAVRDSLTLLSTTATAEGRPVVIRRISEQLQEDAELLRQLAGQGVRPGTTMQARLIEGSVSLDGQLLPAGVAQHLFVSAVDQEGTPLEVAPLL
jgi:DtxR family Mn-dependent transcriptional regulator